MAVCIPSMDIMAVTKLTCFAAKSAGLPTRRNRTKLRTAMVMA